MRLATLALLALAAPAALAQPHAVLYPGASGPPLLDAIAANYAPARTLGYTAARDSLYAYEQRTDGALCGVYTRFCIQLTPGADPSTDAYTQGINAEHTWPQSMGASAEPSKSDLHHLFPAKDNVNSSRSNHPYGEVPDGEADTWYREGASQTFVPVVFVDEWSEKDNAHPDPAWAGRFEPRHDHKGNAARAVFYYRAVHRGQVTAYGSEPFFDVMKDDLVVWHYSDPVDLEEYARSEWIASLQGTPNPFVLDSTLARRAFALSGTPADSSGGGDGPGGGTGSAAGLWVNEVHYDNDGADTGEGVEIAGPAGTSLAGWSLVLYNGNGASVYRTVALSDAVPAQQAGFGTVWVPVVGLQNGAPDGLALVAPDGSVAQFLSYEGVVAAADGPASGLVSADLGVAESGTTPAGYSLQAVGAGAEAEDFAWADAQPATPGAPNAGQTFEAPVVAWLNEVHYDNEGTDANEGVEIAGTAGLDLAGWSVALYNGNGGRLYDTLALSGTIEAEAAGIGVRWFPRAGIQNGAPDGLALVDAEGAVVQFLSYEGALTAADGPAAGRTSEAMGVRETASTPSTHSLQLVGEGAAYADFVWASPAVATPGSVNRSQTFAATGERIGTAAESPPSERLAVAVYPNPSRGAVRVSLRLAAPAEVRVTVYDALGRRVAEVAAGARPTGFHTVPLALEHLPAGPYHVRVEAGPEAEAAGLTIVR